jgi:23S rRNA pseudouridine1911/1915/1917 synthase
VSPVVDREIHLIVAKDQSPVRLDRYLVDQNDSYTRSQIQRWIMEGNVSVKGRPMKAAYVVQPGDEIQVRIPPPRELKARPEAIPLEILYEDKHLAVVNKPAHLVVHAAGHRTEGTLVNALLYHLKDLSQVGDALRPGIVHRLDKGTSGVMIVAKSSEAHFELSRQFHDREISKTYLALAYGTFKQDQGTIETRLGRSRGNRKKISSRTRKGREAKTSFKVLKRYPSMALLEVRPYTGRTHQIRVHLAESGHPVMGYPLYGGKQWMEKLSGEVREKVKVLDHQALHAWKIELKHPITNKKLSFEAELPDDLKNVLKVLDKK